MATLATTSFESLLDTGKIFGPEEWDKVLKCIEAMMNTKIHDLLEGDYFDSNSIQNITNRLHVIEYMIQLLRDNILARSYDLYAVNIILIVV